MIELVDGEHGRGDTQNLRLPGIEEHPHRQNVDFPVEALPVRKGDLPDIMARPLPIPVDLRLAGENAAGRLPLLVELINTHIDQPVAIRK